MNHHTLRDYHDALEALLQSHQPITATEEVALPDLNGRILAAAIKARLDVPHFDNSAMDGWAVNGCERRQWLVRGRIAAGAQEPQAALLPGEAVRIFTGAAVPAATTAVIMQEHVVHSDGQIALADSAATVRPGQHIRRRAEELQAGAPLLPAGQRLNPAAIALLATQGIAGASVLQRLRVTVFASGNELTPVGTALGPGRIHDSNRVMLLSWLQACGCIVTDGGILPDRLQATQQALTEAARSADAIVCSGGASVGEEDHLKQALSQAGELEHWRLAIKPGKPFGWGHLPRDNGICRVFMLPGNPVSSLATFHLLALPALLRLAGCCAEQARPLRFQAHAAFSRSGTESRREFLRVTLALQNGRWLASATSRQGSNMISGAAQAHALAEVPPHAAFEAGALLTVYPLFAPPGLLPMPAQNPQ